MLTPSSFSRTSPRLIEVNHSPSFNIDSPLDLAIKEALITDTIQLARIDPKLINRAKKAEKKASNGRLMDPLQKKKEDVVDGAVVTAGGGGGAPESLKVAAAAAAAAAAKQGGPRTFEDVEAQR